MQRLTSLPVRSYRDLVVWQKSMSLVVEIYRQTELFPKAETYGLTAQLRRAAVSIPSNIAEGHARLSTGEYRHFLGQARGSLVEVETQILISRELGYFDQGRLVGTLQQTAEVGKLLNALISSLSLHKHYR